MLSRLFVTLALWLAMPPAFSHDFTDRFSAGGVVAGVPQYQQVSNAPGTNDEPRAGLALQPEARFRPTAHDELFIKLGFGVGNGLNQVSPFNLAPWAAELEDDVSNINGRDRDYLLAAWYQHRFRPGESASVALSAGLIDATDYVDQNVFASDEYTQFMNQALVNAPNGFAPSYDRGMAAELEIGNYTLNGVFMSVGENDDGNSYRFYAAQLAYRLKTPLGEGNYRIIGQTASDDFRNTRGDREENRTALLFSFDQRLGGNLGAWLRCGWQDDQAAVDYARIYSGGFALNGNHWQRPHDEIGLGIAYLDNGNGDLELSRVAESYARFALDRHLALTVDVQYLQDEYGNTDNPSGFIYGLRLAAVF